MTGIAEEFRRTIDYFSTLPPPSRLWFILGGTPFPDRMAPTISARMSDVIVCDRQGRTFLRGEEVVTDDLQSPQTPGNRR